MANTTLQDSWQFRTELVPGYTTARVINGCWQLAVGHGGNSEAEPLLFRRLEALVDAGFTTFDCADIYTGVEALLGRFIRRLRQRQEIQVHTKYVPDLSRLGDLKATDVESSVNRSLARLGLERLDMVQFHWWDYSIPGYLDALSVLERLKQEGKIRLLGLTNFNTRHVSEMVNAGIKPDTLQVQYSLVDRRPVKKLARFCASQKISLLCYGSLAGGLLSDRALDTGHAMLDNRSVQKYRLVIEDAGGWPEYQNLLKSLGQIANRLQTSIASVAACWVLAQPGVAAVILGIGGGAHIAENQAMLQTVIPDGDLQEIDKVLANMPMLPGDVFDLERDPEGPHAAHMKMNLNTEPPR